MIRRIYYTWLQLTFIILHACFTTLAMSLRKEALTAVTANICIPRGGVSLFVVGFVGIRHVEN